MNSTSRNASTLLLAAGLALNLMIPPAHAEFNRGGGAIVNREIAVYLPSPKQPKLVLNDLDALTGTVLPDLAEQYGLADLVSDTDQIFHDVLTIHDPIQNKDINCMEVTITFDTLVSLPVDEDDVQAEWAGGEQLRTEWDVNSTFLASLTIDVEDRDGEFGFLGLGGGNFFCDVTWEFVESLLGGEGTHVYAVTAGDFSGELDVTLADLGGRIGIESIDFVSLTFEDFFTLGSITAVYDGDCGSTADCLLSSLLDPIMNDIEDAINDSLDYSLTSEGGFGIGGARMDYDVGLHDIRSNGAADSFTATSDVELTPDNVDACAAGMRQAAYAETDIEATEYDLDVEVPFGLVSEVVYQTGQSGLFCRNVSHDLDAELFAPADVPGVNTSAHFEADLEPNGTMVIDEAPDGEQFVLALLTGQDTSPLEVTIPVTLKNATIDGAPAGGADEEITANMRLQGFFVLNCDQGLELYVYDADVTDLSGEISHGGFTQDAAVLQTAMEDAVWDMLRNDLGQVFPIIPKVNSLKHQTSLAIVLETVTSDANGARVGFNVVEDTGECADWSTLQEGETHSQACMELCAEACVVDNVCVLELMNECLAECELTDEPRFEKKTIPADWRYLPKQTVTASCAESCAEECVVGNVCMNDVFEECLAECEGSGAGFVGPKTFPSPKISGGDAEPILGSGFKPSGDFFEAAAAGTNKQVIQTQTTTSGNIMTGTQKKNIQTVPFNF